MIHEAYVGLLYVIQKPNAVFLQLICIIISTNIKSIVLNVNSLLFGMRNTITCLNNSSSVLMKFGGKTKSTVNILVVVMLAYLIFGSFPFLIRWLSGNRILMMIPFMITNIQEIMISMLLITLLNISHLSLEDINNNIISLNTNSSDAAKIIEGLMFRHSEVCELLDTLSRCFGFNIVLQCGFNLSKIVLISYYAYFLLVTSNKLNIDHLITTTEVPYRCLAIWYLGHKCDQINNQVGNNVIFYYL